MFPVLMHKIIYKSENPVGLVCKYFGFSLNSRIIEINKCETVMQNPDIKETRMCKNVI